MQDNQIGSVIVTYNPDPITLTESIKSTLLQVTQLVIVNNSDESLHTLINCSLFRKNSVTIIENNNNLGVSKALNIGITKLIELNCSYFLLLDQDSIVPNGMVKGLIETFNQVSATQKIAAIGPAFYDQSLQAISPFIKFDKNKTVLLHPSDKNILYPHLLITSGTVISINALQEVGLMDESLFIDHVDNEWCLRAHSKGFLLAANSNFVMQHSIGNDPIRVMNRLFHNHSPIRRYYFSRNTTLLFKRNYIPFTWRKRLMLIAIKQFIFYVFFSKQKIESCKMGAMGFVHGLFNKTGRLNLIEK